jgi:hypothetical protein
MIDLTLGLITGLVTAILPAASSEDGAVWLLAAGPVGGVATYWAIYRYYRNHDKTHEFERDTIIHPQPVKGGEAKVGHISRTRNSQIENGNEDDFRRRVQRVR